MARTSKVTKEDKEKAILLRTEGLTYKDISTNLGVTEAWCKINLKSVIVESDESLARAEIYLLAVRPEGVSYTEACGVLVKYNFNDDESDKESLYDVYKKMKQGLTSKFDNVLFRPLWVRPNDAIRSLNVLNTIADELYQRIEGYVDDYVDQIYPDYENTDGIRKSVLYEVIQLVSPTKGFDSVQNRCNSNSKLATKLRERCGVIEPTTLIDLEKYRPNNKAEDLSYLPF